MNNCVATQILYIIEFTYVKVEDVIGDIPIIHH